jgi:hypothetical protein
MAKNNLPIWCRENFSVRPEQSKPPSVGMALPRNRAKLAAMKYSYRAFPAKTE